MYPELTSKDVATKGRMTSAHRGSRCMQKVIIEDAIEYQEGLQCTMVSKQSCSITFKTVFKAKTVHECQEYFQKTCTIEFKPVIHYKRIQICRNYPAQRCSEPNQIMDNSRNTTCVGDHVRVCILEESEPFASCPQSIHDQCSFSKETQATCLRRHLKLGHCPKEKTHSTGFKAPSPVCRNVPQQICLSDSCSRVEKRTCGVSFKKIVIDTPQERCTLVPLERCGTTTKIMPSLQPQEMCVNTPKEICQLTSLVPMRRIKLPRIRKWCEETTTRALD